MTVSPAARWIVQQPKGKGGGGHVLTVQSHDLQYDKEDLDLWSFALTPAEMRQLDAAALPPDDDAA